VFVEDTAVVCEELAVLTRPGTPARRAEVAGVAQTVQALGLRPARIDAPGVLDGGDGSAGRRVDPQGRRALLRFS
jgi:dimethylargininase